ncbi:MAG: NUDIX domain-containing protein [Syntrophobacteraceae bacterium]
MTPRQGDKQGYVLGFVFTSTPKNVLLTEKNCPDWQKGKWNGIGGKIEAGEKPIDAMVREMFEETTISISAPDWHHYATMVGDDFQCFVFAASCFFDHFPCACNPDTGERLLLVPISQLSRFPRLANTSFLIEAALVRDSFKHLQIGYHKNGATGQTV